MNYMIVTRNPNGKGLLTIMTGDECEEIAQYETEEEAIDVADNQPLCIAWGYQIVELEI
jgi:hypothetical protein